MKIGIKNEMICGSVFFHYWKSLFISYKIFQEAGVCSIPYIELGETQEEEERPVKQASFDVKMLNGTMLNIFKTAKTMDDAISNAFDICTQRVTRVVKNTF